MKKKDIYFDTVEHFNEYYGFETLHPLVSVVRYDRPHAIQAATYTTAYMPCFSRKTRAAKSRTGAPSTISTK